MQTMSSYQIKQFEKMDEAIASVFATVAKDDDPYHWIAVLNKKGSGTLDLYSGADQVAKDAHKGAVLTEYGAKKMGLFQPTMLTQSTKAQSYDTQTKKN